MRFVAASMALVLVAAACGRDPLPETAAPEPTPAGDPAPVKERLVVAHARGVSIVNIAAGKVERDLPHGIMSPDRNAYWAIEPGQRTTSIRKLDPSSGTEIAKYGIAGSYDLPKAYGPRADAISSNGRFLTLVAPETDAFGFTVVDLRDGSEKGSARLPGTFSFDAIDDLGTSLYLLEHPQPGVARFNVRLYDLAVKTLSPSVIVDGKRPQPSAADLARGTMGGIYHATATAGMWHLGLYVSTTRGPVVHALNMTARFAFCLLELAGMPTHRSAWAIAPAPSGDRAFVVNAATGGFASVTTSDLTMATRSFKVQQGRDGDLRATAVVSRDGASLYATGGKGVLVIDLRTLSLKAQILADRELTSVMVSPDGGHLFVLDRAGTISRIDARTGEDLGAIAHLPSAVSIVALE